MGKETQPVDLYPIVLQHGTYIVTDCGEQTEWLNVTPIINHDQSITLTSNGEIVGYIRNHDSIGATTNAVSNT